MQTQNHLKVNTLKQGELIITPLKSVQCTTN